VQIAFADTIKELQPQLHLNEVIAQVLPEQREKQFLNFKIKKKR
jgi:hypothetical protein